MAPELLVTGALNWDINLFVHRLAKPGEEVVVDRIDQVPGGKIGVALRLLMTMNMGGSSPSQNPAKKF